MTRERDPAKRGPNLVRLLSSVAIVDVELRNG
jgi:hypothetical protein